MSELLTTQLSFVYVESVLDLLTGAVSNPPYAFLANRLAFAQKFDAALAKRSGDIQPPWPDRAGRGFWAYYFEEQRPLPTITGVQAWRGVTPMRVVAPFAPTVDDTRVRIAIDSFVYPHGVGVIVNATISGVLNPLDAATLAVKLRREPVFIVDAVTKPMVLDALAARALDSVRAAAFGATAPVGRRPQFPFTIATVILGKGIDDTHLPSDGSDEHRFLDAVTTWSPTWQTAALGTVAEHQLAARSDGVPAGHIVYKHDRCRAVWFPGSFTIPSGYVRTLTCFHRNLVLASLQVESLAGLATATAAYLADGQSLSDAHFDAVYRSGNVLGRLYGGARSTYRSRSPQTQIDDAGLAADINAARAAVGQQALFAPA